MGSRGKTVKVNDVCHDRKQTESGLTTCIPPCSNQHPEHFVLLHHLSPITAKFLVRPSLPKISLTTKIKFLSKYVLINLAPQRNGATRMHKTLMILYSNSVFTYHLNLSQTPQTTNCRLPIPIPIHLLTFPILRETELSFRRRSRIFQPKESTRILPLTNTTKHPIHATLLNEPSARGTGKSCDLPRIPSLWKRRKVPRCCARTIYFRLPNVPK